MFMEQLYSIYSLSLHSVDPYVKTSRMSASPLLTAADDCQPQRDHARWAQKGVRPPDIRLMNGAGR
jgi:hypothetical protein